MSNDLLVIGAGPAGLATALSAARHGARVLVVERHHSTSIHPRASGLSTRTMEIFRTLGRRRRRAHRELDGPRPRRVRDHPRRPRPRPRTPIGFPLPREALAVSPTFPACCAQDLLEPILLDAVRRAGVDVRFDTELTDLAVDDAGAWARVHDRVTGATTTVRSRFVVGADGPRSRVRTALGIDTEHLGGIGRYVQLLFRADLSAVLGDHAPRALLRCTHPEAGGLLIAFGGEGDAARWGFARPCPTDDDIPADDAAWTAMLRTVTGIEDLRPELLGTAVFDLDAELATATRAGAAFLVGDAAHRMTPVGAVGLNTAVQDGHNLGWKLAWAAQDRAGEPLLASYAAERVHVGERRARRSVRPGEPDPADGLLGDLGVGYASPVLAGAAPTLVEPADLAAAPGERAPHVWVHVDGRRCSTLDLWDGRLTAGDRRPDLARGRRGPRPRRSRPRRPPARERLPARRRRRGARASRRLRRLAGGRYPSPTPSERSPTPSTSPSGSPVARANGEFVRLEAANPPFVRDSRRASAHARGRRPGSWSRRGAPRRCRSG